MVWRPQGSLEEALGGAHRASKRAGNQSCRLSSPCSIQIGPFAGSAKVGIIHPPRSVRVPQFASTTPTEFRSIVLDPAPNRNVIYVHVPLGHDLLEIAQASAKRRYRRTQLMISGSKCRPLNAAGRSRRMSGQAYQTRAAALQHFQRSP
jgi:hypothetical protein